MKNFGFRKLMIFIILSASVALAYQLPYMRYTFYDQMAAALQLTDTQMGLLATALTFTNTLCYPIGGFFAERFSMKKLICITLAAYATLTALFAFTTNFYILIGIHVLYGFFGIATLWSAYLSGLRTLADENNQSTIFGSSEATRGVLQTITAFAFLGIMNVAATPILGFKLVMLAGAGFTGIFLILALIFLPKEGVQEEGAADDVKYTLKDILKNKGVWLTIWVIMCAYVSWTLGNGYLTTYTVRVLNVSQSVASTIGVVRSYVIVFLAGFIGGWVLDRFSYKGKGFFLLFSAVIVTCAAIMLTSKAVAVSIGLTLLLAFLANVMKSTYWSIMGQAGIPLKMTAIATGIISFIAFIPDFIVPTLCGVWLDAATAAGNVTLGFNKIFLLLIGFSVVGLIGAALLTKQTKSLEKAKATE